MIEEIELGEFDLDSFISESAVNESTVNNAGESVARQVVFVIDASNSMQGYKIGAVNDCVNNTISKLRSLDRSKENPISISVIGFSSKLFKWTDSFVPASEFKYSYVEMVDGLTDVNAAFHELATLTNKSMEKEARKYVVFFSDGLSTEDVAESFKQWELTALFPEITRIIVAFDDDLHDPQSMDFFRVFASTGLIVPITEQEQLLTALLS